MMSHFSPHKQNRTNTARIGSNNRRSGSVLVAVLVVVMLLTLGTYSFTMLMLSELEATSMYERDAQSRAYADSGIEWIATVLGEQNEGAVKPDVYNNPELFGGILMRDAKHPRGRGRFSAVVGIENDPAGNSIRFGLMDESSKFNLNTLLSFDLNEEQQRDVLLALPEMTIELADAILDWLDEDERPRQYGAENEYYETLNPPYQAKNARLESLDELLQVRGVTTALLYGEDTNRNGLLDPVENDGELSPPYDNADGTLKRGWNAYLTVYSRELNLQDDGTPRINVNEQNLSNLYDAIRSEFDEETARFIVAYRLYGPTSEGGGNSGSSEPNGRNAAGSGSNRRSGGSLQPSETRNSAGGPSNSGGSGEKRGGLDLSGGGRQPISSLYDLIGVNVRAEVNGEQRELESPWSDDPAALGDSLVKLLETLTTSSEEFLEGRINITQAPRDVLMMIPELDEQLVEAIAGAQRIGGSASYQSDPLRATSGWLLSDGIVDLEKMRALDPYVTSQGDVYKAQIVGHFDSGGPVTRLEVVFDATQSPPRVVAVRDLTGLGWGFSAEQLLQGQSGF